MLEFLDTTINLSQILSNLGHLVFSYLLAFPIGLNREKASRSGGYRTFPLVSVASCGFMLIGATSFDEQQALSRIIYGVMAGMGFIGGGAILKGSKNVHGTATAASLWATAAIGVSVALHFYEIAIVLAVTTFLTFWIKKTAE